MGTVIPIANSKGVPFTVRVVEQGEGYGLLREDGSYPRRNESADPLVEFYDGRYRHTQYGQFVSRYHARTLANADGGALLLGGGVADWFVDGEGYHDVIRLAKQITKGF